MSAEGTPIFETDTYGTVLTVTPVGPELPDWLWISSEDKTGLAPTEHPRMNVLNRDEIEALRDVLTAWLDEHPVRPDPFANGGSVEWNIDGEVFTVTLIGE